MSETPRPGASAPAAGTTTRDGFRALAADHRVIPVLREVFADGETPVGVHRKLTAGRPGTFLLESAGQGGIWTRFSFVGVSSFGVLTQQGDEARWLDYGIDAERALGDDAPAGPLAALAALYARWETPRIPGLPPLTGGLVGFIGWEAVRQIERLPDRPPAEVPVPGQALSFVSELAVLDHRRGTVTLVATALNDGVDDEDAMWADAQARLDRMQADPARPSETFLAEVDLQAQPSATLRTEPADFHEAIARSKHHIHEGDVFQVVVSQRFDQPTTAEPIDVYRILRVLNPSPYMYLLALEDADGKPYSIVGSSPEALVTVTDDHVYMHPIAGSRPRGATVEEDVAHEESLLADPKERAEHLMLVDLARNDMLKACAPGSVEVTEFMRVERFSHIMHLVSSVEGTLRPGVSSIDVFRATFPAGTLSGAPKVRALEILSEMELVPRGPYGGAVVALSANGDLESCIAIRALRLESDRAILQAGAGIVADSQPRAEWQETLNKARGLLKAIEITEQRTG